MQNVAEVPGPNADNVSCFVLRAVPEFAINEIKHASILLRTSFFCNRMGLAGDLMYWFTSCLL